MKIKVQNIPGILTVQVPLSNDRLLCHDQDGNAHIVRCDEVEKFPDAIPSKKAKIEKEPKIEDPSKEE